MEDGRIYRKYGDVIEEIIPFRVGRSYSMGYKVISFRSKNLLVHRIIFAKYKGPLIKGLVINHIDGNKHNNHYLNLEQITNRSNITHAKNMGLLNGLIEYHKKLKEKNTLLKKERCDIIQKLLKDGCTFHCIGHRLGISAQRVHQIYKKEGLIVES